VIRYRCPSCRHIDERPDRDAGQTVACTTCGQKLRVPQAPKDVVLAEPLPPAPKRSWVDWVWRPAPRTRRENSAETLIRVGLNVIIVWFLFQAALLILAVLACGLAGRPI
jgi:DNA-directed RNA polymerase subunit RPC12/RpoP